MTLYSVIIAFERIHILAKHQCCRRIDGEAREILNHIGIGSSIRILLPASAQPIAYVLQRRKEALEISVG